MKISNLVFFLLFSLCAFAVASPIPLSHKVIDPVSPSVVGKITKRNEKMWFLYWNHSHFNLMIQPQKVYYLYNIDDEVFIVFVDNDNNEYKLLIIDYEQEDDW